MSETTRIWRSVRLSALALLAVFAASGCALGLGKSMHEYSMVDVENPLKHSKAKEIKAETSQYVFLSFTFNTDYADEAYAAIQSACPKGEVFNIRARYSTDLGFLAYRNKLVVSALCDN